MLLKKKNLKSQSLNFDRETGTFFVEEPKSTFVMNLLISLWKMLKTFLAFLKETLVIQKKSENGG